MQDALVKIVLDTIHERYVSENAFYSTRLGIAPQSWTRWKNGQRGFKYDNMRILSSLFTDYEWMLVQKVTRNAQVLTEVERDPVYEYKQLKIAVAKKWLASGLCQSEWYETETDNQIMRDGVACLRLVMAADFWSYADMIELRVPKSTQIKLATAPKALLEWLETDAIESVTRA
ncbi:hypothetical protein D3H64_03690 [Atopobacter sp. AH10]|uniref:hypothetical protein n=1 Tax=Atopobacter sp. AH10 TaxID=2315861 RepID=UPI000EF1A97D|nr:hypothetical protein [Atopobacter sp. AH10]RLK63540.1 hypothetical protein D3H64_03690 [Atopobacter sp. AH10]